MQLVVVALVALAAQVAPLDGGPIAAGAEIRCIYSGVAGEAIDVILRASGADWDPVLEVYAPTGELLAFDGGGRLNAALRAFRLSRAGTYTIAARALGDRGAGGYTLTLSHGCPHP